MKSADGESPPVATGGLSDWQWFHCIIGTYGSWLPGDPRGFRTRHHREHVDGDYKNPPPPGFYEKLHARSQELLKQDAVTIPPELRSVVGNALKEMLRDRLEAELIVLSASGQHVHLLAKMPGGPTPRQWVGRAKKHAKFIANEHGWNGELWAVRCKVVAIRNRQHQLNAFNYILEHDKEGAWVWSFRDNVKKSAHPESPPVATGGLSCPPSPSASSILQQLVRLPSVNPMGRADLPAAILYESRVGELIESILQSRGIPFTRQPVATQRFNVIATYEPANPSCHLLFEAHLDTVPVDGMSIEPFAGDIREGKLFGRGACDVKAGVAAMLTAFLRLFEEKKATAKVTVAFCVDEEHTFLGVEELVRSGLRADFAVVAEPTKLNLVTQHKGVTRWTTETFGTACHSSRPQDGVNAVYLMAKVLAAIEAYATRLTSTRSDAALGPPTLSVGVIHGGVSPNTVPDSCRIEVDRRLIPGESAASALEEYQAMLNDRAFDFKTRTTLVFACPPLGNAAETHPLLEKLRTAIISVHGPPRLEAVPYGTDASSLAEAGIPCVVFGPGDIAQAHTHDEWVDLAEVEAAAEILYRFSMDS